MTDSDPTLQDVWRLLGSLNRRIESMDRRINERIDGLEREVVAINARISAKIGALKESIEGAISVFCLRN